MTRIELWREIASLRKGIQTYRFEHGDASWRSSWRIRTCGKTVSCVARWMMWMGYHKRIEHYTQLNGKYTRALLVCIHKNTHLLIHTYTYYYYLYEWPGTQVIEQRTKLWNENVNWSVKRGMRRRVIRLLIYKYYYKNTCVASCRETYKRKLKK